MSRGCPLCGTEPSLDLAACVTCASATGGRLLFVDPPDTGIKRTALAQRLKRLLPGATGGREMELAAAGHQALLAVPAAALPGMIFAFDAVGVRLVAPRSGGVWLRIPTGLRAVLMVLIGVGLLAGWVANSMFFWTTPAVGGLLLLLTRQAIVRPAHRPPREQPLLGSQRTAAAVRERLAGGLPAGRSRELLADLVRACRVADERQRNHGDDEGAESLRELLEAGTSVASELARLERLRPLLADSGASLEDRSRLDHHARSLEKVLLGAIRVTSSSDRGSSDAATAGEELASMASRVRNHVEAWDDAIRETAALVSTDRASAGRL